jgi:hypothetical protein
MIPNIPREKKNILSKTDKNIVVNLLLSNESNKMKNAKA